MKWHSLEKKWGIYGNNVIIDYRTGQVLADSDGDTGKAMEIFANIQTPGRKKQLEERLRDLLQGKEESFECIDEHTQIFANRSVVLVKSFIIPGKKEPIENTYPTINVYWLLCKYNILYDNIEMMKRGAKDVIPPFAELDRRMKLVKDIEVK